MKRMLFLGAAPHQCPAIRYALARGLEVYTTDNRPDNPGHALARQAFAVNAADADAVTVLAARLNVHAVIGYASEVCAVTAAQVAHRLGLPGPPVEAVLTLARKDRFRALGDRTGLQPLAWAAFAASERQPAQQWCRTRWDRPGVLVKPADASGSNGVTVRPDEREFDDAFDYAVAASLNSRIIVEEFVPRTGSQFTGDGFVVDGRLHFFWPMDNRTIEGGKHPAITQERAPSGHPDAWMARLWRRLEDLIRAAGYWRGPFNIDGIFRPDGEPFLIEIAPRNGGNFIPQALRHHTGFDVMAAAVDAAIDPSARPPPWSPPIHGRAHACYMLHARQPGRLVGYEIAPSVRARVLEEHPYPRPGDPVRPFRKAGDAVGNLILEFPSPSAMRATMDRMGELCRVVLA